ncbi:transporter [uncultured Winogradskyella sp.]|uniref:transporter n=1 Tax=uncultured Winogradskyella sp. TaxID=395353 RepID=UPI00260E3A02|nr:transporter [uncultured Winogradskyella sp.]
MKSVILVCIVLSSFCTYGQGRIDGFYRGQSNTTLVFGYGIEDSQSYLIGREPSTFGRTLRYFNMFASYGVSDNLDIQVSLPYLESDTNKSLQDISLFSKYRFYNKNTLSGQLQLSAALGFSTPVNDYDIGGLNDLGQQATVIDTRVMVHYKWHTNWFATAQSGFSFKLEEVPNSIPFVFKIGKATKNWYYDAYYDFQYAIGGIDYRGTPSPQNFRELGVSYHKPGATLYRSLGENFGIYLTYSYVVDGRNAFIGPSYGVGLTYDL